MTQNNDLMSFKRFYKDYSMYIKTDNDLNDNNSNHGKINFSNLKKFFEKNRNEIIDKISIINDIIKN